VPFSVRFLCRSNSPFVRFCGGTRFLCVAPILLRAPSKRPHPRRLSPSGCPGAAGGVPGGGAVRAAAPDAQQHCEDVCWPDIRGGAVPAGIKRVFAPPPGAALGRWRCFQQSCSSGGGDLRLCFANSALCNTWYMSTCAVSECL
jgi:hypothetical protein